LFVKIPNNRSRGTNGEEGEEGGGGGGKREKKYRNRVNEKIIKEESGTKL
jgi:hypothetical protein